MKHLLVSATISIILLFLPFQADTAGAWGDTIPPTVTSVSPSGTSGISGVVIQVNYFDTGSASNPGLLSWREIYVDDTLIYPNAGANQPASCTFTQNSDITCTMNIDLTASPHTVHGYLRDYGYNITSFSSSFTASSPLPPSSDVLPPELDVIYGIAPSRVSFQDNFLFWARFSDAAPSSGVVPESASFDIDGITVSCQVSNLKDVKCSSPPLSRGIHPFTFSMADAAGNTVTYSSSIRKGLKAHVRDDATGGDCPLIGNWDSASRTCTIGQDFDDVIISVDSDNVTVDGGGHGLSANSGFVAIQLNNRTGVTVCDFRLVSYYYGISIIGGGWNRVTGNLLSTDIGIVVDSSTNNVIEGNKIQNSSPGIGLSNSTDNLIRGNQVGSDWIPGYQVAIDLSLSSGNTISGNVIDLAWAGIYLYGSTGNNIDSNNVSTSGPTAELAESNANVFTSNDFSSQGDGLKISYFETTPPTDQPNIFYHNNFLQNTGVQFLGNPGTDLFSQVMPTGGNYWQGWNGPDADGDGIIDNPIVFVGGQDEFPWTTASGWTKPVLTTSLTRTYWQDYASYLAQELSVDFSISNSGPAATTVNIIGSVCTNGVSMVTTTPLAIGDIVTGQTDVYTLKYTVPSGASFFRTTNYATAIGSVGTYFEYPGPFPEV
ncbi:MAG: right-handed parallel beta-helix repeat-containing protein [Actinobacteria bacterium]|nr:right-handed parallel beta-helix repeat-containing protein [Actinomycetota bacterium]